MSEYPEIAARFARDTASHQMTVLHDDGLYRHLRFTNPQRGEYWFDLIALPHNLIFRGDGESYVFSIFPTKDLFDLFRKSSYKGGINPQYWSEKLTSDRDSVTKYSQDLFNEQVAGDLKGAEGDYPGVTEAWSEKVDGFLAEFNTEYEHGARTALDEFEFGDQFKGSCSCGDEVLEDERHDATMWTIRHPQRKSGEHKTAVERVEGFRFYDTSEWNLQDYHWWFLWACNAIVWGIGRYDKLARYGLLNLATRKQVAA